MGDARTAIMRTDVKLPVAEARHRLDHVIGHRALGIGLVPRIGDGFIGTAITPKIEAKDPVGRCEQRRHGMPHRRRLWIAMEQNDGRRTLGAAMTHEQPRPRALDIAFFKAAEHGPTRFASVIIHYYRFISKDYSEIMIKKDG